MISVTKTFRCLIQGSFQRTRNSSRHNVGREVRNIFTLLIICVIHLSDLILGFDSIACFCCFLSCFDRGSYQRFHNGRRCFLVTVTEDSRFFLLFFFNGLKSLECLIPHRNVKANFSVATNSGNENCSRSHRRARWDETLWFDWFIYFSLILNINLQLIDSLTALFEIITSQYHWIEYIS